MKDHHTLSKRLGAELICDAAALPAVTDGKRTLSYQELISAVEFVADWLAGEKVTSVALHGENSIDWIIVDLACQDANIRCIPLPGFFSQSQSDICVHASGVDLLLTDSNDFLNGFKDQNSDARQITAPCAFNALRLTPPTVPHNGEPAAPKCPAGTQKITFTSGSTGSPKGVCLSADHQWSTARALSATISINRPKHLCILPFATLLENIAGIYAPLLSGGTVMVPGDAERGLSGSSQLDAARFLSCISASQATTLILIPQLLSVLVAACERGWTPPGTLKFIAVGGAKVSAKLLEQATAAGLPVFEGYGLSECGSVVALSTPAANQAGSVGKILPHCSVTASGERITVQKPVFLGYFDDPASWYPESVETGDLGKLSGEYLTIFGRSKNILISSFGRNISPEWIESELMAKPVLSHCVVLGDARPYLAALLSADEAVSDAQIQSWIWAVNSTLPDYGQVKAWHRLQPAQWAAYLTANGRPQRAKINTDFDGLIETLYQPTTDNGNILTMTSKNGFFFARLQAETLEARSYLMSAPIIKRCMEGDITRDDYAAFLLQAYHHVKHTTPLLMAAGSRMPGAKEWLREALAEYIEEELGHQEWILNDIESCGFDKEMARHSKPNPATELMVSYAYDTINRINPVGFFGMVYVLEGTSVKIADQAADSIESALGLPKKAFSYLRSHGALDQEHIKFFENLMNRIDDVEDQDQIIHCANMFFHLYGNVFRELDETQAQQIAA